MSADGVWYEVSSSNVQAARRTAEGDLEVSFRPKGRRGRVRTWRYPSAGRELEALLSAPSAGKFVKWQLRAQYGDGEEIT